MATQETWIDFQAVKKSVTMADLLARYKIDLRRVNQTYLRGNCPLPTHQSDTKGSLTVHTEKNIWSCKSDSCVKNRDGKKGGNVLDFVAIMAGLRPARRRHNTSTATFRNPENRFTKPLPPCLK